MMSVLSDFYSLDVVKEGHKYSKSGIYHQIPTTNDHNVIM